MSLKAAKTPVPFHRSSSPGSLALCAGCRTIRTTKSRRAMGRCGYGIRADAMRGKRPLIKISLILIYLNRILRGFQRKSIFFSFVLHPAADNCLSHDGRFATP